MKRRLALLISALALIAAACSSSGEPTKLADQPGPIAANLAGALSADENPDSVPLIERNFIEGCVNGEQPRVSGLSSDALLRTCGCSYRAAEQYAQNLARGETEEQLAEDALVVFKGVDDNLKDSAGVIPAELLTQFEACRS